jgi:hypothetical protein
VSLDNKSGQFLSGTFVTADVQVATREGPLAVKAIGLAGVVLVIAILPAEYGVDPTGVGERIGLTAMSNSDPAEAADAELGELIEPTTNQGEGAGTPISPLEAVWKSDRPFRTDEMSLTL